MIEGRSIELEKTVLVGIINSNQNEEKSKNLAFQYGSS